MRKRMPTNLQGADYHVFIEANLDWNLSTMLAHAFKKHAAIGGRVIFATDEKNPHRIGVWTENPSKEAAARILQTLLGQSRIHIDTNFYGDRESLKQELMRMRRRVKRFDSQRGPIMEITGKVESRAYEGKKDDMALATFFAIYYGTIFVKSQQPLVNKRPLSH